MGFVDHMDMCKNRRNPTGGVLCFHLEQPEKGTLKATRTDTSLVGFACPKSSQHWASLRALGALRRPPRAAQRRARGQRPSAGTLFAPSGLGISWLVC